MKHKRFFRLALLLGSACMFLLLGCGGDDEGDPLGSGEIVTSVQATDGTKYFSLSTGEQVTDPANPNWDIAVRRTRLILTNSGASATEAGSGGQGGVWHTDKTGFDSVTMADKIDFAPFNTDVPKYIWSGMGARPTAATTLNVMSYVGYGNDSNHNNTGDGESSDTAWSEYKYDQKQYYRSDAAMGSASGPGFAPTGQVYIIRHGDGVHHSKIQIEYEFQASPAADNFVIKYGNLD